MGESTENSDWDSVLAGSLRKKLRSEGMRTDFMSPSAREAARPSALEPAAPEPAAPVPGPVAPAFDRRPSAPAGASDISGARRGVSSAQMVVEQLRRSLGPRDEKRALDVLGGRGGPRGGAGLVAAGALVVLVSAGTAFVLGQRPGGGGELRLASAIVPPREAPFPGAGPVGPALATTGERGAMPPAHVEPGGKAVGEAGPVFRVGKAATETEWVDLGGRIVDLDRFPPRTSAGP